MVQIFDEAIQSHSLPIYQAGPMREAYIRALSVLDLMDEAERLRLAMIIFDCSKLEPLPRADELTTLAISRFIESKSK